MNTKSQIEGSEVREILEAIQEGYARPEVHLCPRVMLDHQGIPSYNCTLPPDHDGPCTWKAIPACLKLKNYARISDADGLNSVDSPTPNLSPREGEERPGNRPLHECSDGVIEEGGDYPYPYEEDFVVLEMERAISIFQSRNKEYKNNYIDIGIILFNLFPKGFELKTRWDFAKFAAIIQVVTKMTRYANNVKEGHKDSLDDLSIYAQMLKHLHFLEDEDEEETQD